MTQGLYSHPKKQSALLRFVSGKVNEFVTPPYRDRNDGRRRWEDMGRVEVRKLLRMVLAAGLIEGSTACTKPHQYIDVTCAKMAGETVLDREAAIQCQTFRQAEAATAVYNEATLLVKSYRACLEKYEQTPSRAKEYCAQYPKALQEIGLQIQEQPEPGKEQLNAAPSRTTAGTAPLKSR